MHTLWMGLAIGFIVFGGVLFSRKINAPRPEEKDED